ncbi:MAG: 16S rRNA (cytosine(1402)-N(4))-methyltransferase RsmH [bacterium]|nr:16S rRNA (cytosine(1402)-N(4))-methyltransferase RsmH [bacterium]
MGHIPVLLKEVITALEPKDGAIIIDGTAGGGGHSAEILKHIGNTGTLIALDWDDAAIALLKKKFANDPRVQYFVSNYAALPRLIQAHHFQKADGLLIDLGFSSDQLLRGRGFSFQSDDPLIMTYNDVSESLSAFLKHTTVAELTDIIRAYGEERYAPRIAKAIYEARTQVTTTRQLADVIQRAVPRSYERGRLHPATRTFQALRIYLNRELENLEHVIAAVPDIVKPGGRVVIISFHSLEDRIVKTSFKTLASKGRIDIMTKKPISAEAHEIQQNPRARSAKLRAARIRSAEYEQNQN